MANYFYLLFAQAFHSMAPLAIAPFIIYFGGLKEWGYFASFLLYGSIISAIFSGLIQSIQTDLIHILKNINNKQALKIHAKLSKEGVKFFFIPICLLYIISLTLYFAETNIQLSIICLGLSYGISFSLVTFQRLGNLITRNYKRLAIISMIFLFLKIVVTICLLKYELNLFWLCIGFLVITFLEVIARNHTLKLNNNSVRISNILKLRSLLIMLPVSIMTLSLIIDRIIVEFLFDKESFGIYSLFVMLVSAFVFIFSPLNQKLLIEHHDDKTRHIYIYLIVSFFIVLMIFYEYLRQILMVVDNSFVFQQLLHDNLIFISMILVSFLQVINGIVITKRQINQDYNFYRRYGILSFFVNILIIPYLVHLYQLKGAVWGLLFCVAIQTIFIQFDRFQIKKVQH